LPNIVPADLANMTDDALKNMAQADFGGPNNQRVPKLAPK